MEERARAARGLRADGFTAWCGVELEEVGRGYCRAFCAIEAHHLNPAGVVHGGMTATLMDVCAGTAAVFADGAPRRIVTQSAEIHYLLPLTGARAAAEARVLHAGRRTCVTSVEVRGGDGALAASGTYEFFYTE